VQRLHVGLDRLLGIERRAVAAAFQERNARYHGITMQGIERVDHRLFDQPMDHEPMLVRVDLGFAASRNHEMQAIGRDGAVEEMMRRARRAAARLELGVTQRAHNLLLEVRGLAIRGDGYAGREAPGTVGQRLGGGAGHRATRTRGSCAGKHNASPKQRAPMQQAIAGDRLRQ